VVSHLLLGDNYEAAWELLTKRNEKRRKISFDHINRLMDLPNLNLKSNKQTKIFFEVVNGPIYIIKLRRQLSEDLDAVFAHIILWKSNKDSFNLYESNVKKTKEIPALSDVMEFLEQRLSSIVSFPQENKSIR